MTIRLTFIRETEKARLYMFSDRLPIWIPRGVVKSTTKFPYRGPDHPIVHELNIEDWWWEKWEKSQEEPT